MTGDFTGMATWVLHLRSHHPNHRLRFATATPIPSASPSSASMEPTPFPPLLRSSLTKIPAVLSHPFEPHPWRQFRPGAPGNAPECSRTTSTRNLPIPRPGSVLWPLGLRHHAEQPADDVRHAERRACRSRQRRFRLPHRLPVGDVDNNNAQITDVWNISSHTINEARLGYTDQFNFFADPARARAMPEARLAVCQGR